ncbi:MAG: YfhO family protein [Patescibacteria group bacterium]
MKRNWHYTDFFILLSIAIGILIIYRQVVFNGKILFPSNFLAQFYSPWKTEKFPGWEAGIPHKPIGDDQIRIFYPERTFTNEMLAKKIIPLWNPYVFAGTPFLADFQSAIFYPLNILYFFLPQTYAWQLLLFIQPIMATFFMYLFLSLFRLARPAVWLGAIAFGFSGFMIIWSQENVVVGQAALWLPLCLFGIEGYLNTKKNLYYLVAIIALTCSFLAGFFQVTFYIFIFSFFYSIFRIRSLSLPPTYLIKIIGIYVFSLCLSAIQLLPSIEAFLESPRSTSSVWYLFEGYLLPVTHLFNAFVPDIFGNPGAYNFFGRGFYRETILYAGLIPSVFAIYAGIKAKINPVIRFFIGALLLSFFLTLDSPFTRWFFQLPLPLLPTFLPSRILFLTTFSVATLSAFGISTLIKQKREKDLRLMLLIIFVLVITLLLIALYGFLLLNYSHATFFRDLNNYVIRHGSSPTKMNILVLLKNLVLPFIMLSFLFIFLRTKKITNLSFIVIIILTLFGQFYFLNKYIVIGDPQFLYPKNPVISFLQSRNSLDRFLSLRQPMQENISTYGRIYSAEGVNPVFPRRYGELIFAVKNNGKIANDIPRVEARLSELGDKENPFEDNRKIRLLSLLGIKYILYFDDHNPKNSGANKFPRNLFHPVWQHNNWTGIEYSKAFPRAFLTSRIHIQNNPQKIADLLFDANFDLSSNIVLEEKPSELFLFPQNMIDLQEVSPDSLVKITQYEPQKIEIITKTNMPQMLFLSDNYYPGWKAYVDNKETKIYRADYTFRSIYLPKGNHEVTFKYEPISFKIGSTVSILSVIAILAFIFLKRNKMRII